MAGKPASRRRKTARGPRRADWRKPATFPPERRHRPRLAEPSEPPEGVPQERSPELEAVLDQEDDFSDGRSSGGPMLREEEDLWGRGYVPDERPFEESDVPPRRPEPRELD